MEGSKVEEFPENLYKPCLLKKPIKSQEAKKNKKYIKWIATTYFKNNYGILII